MKLSHHFSVLVCACALASLTSCAKVGAPLPPSLELPNPPTDLRAVRKGDKVYLAWTAPARTTDRESMRHLGPTRICRSPQTAVRECGTPAGQVDAPPRTGPSGRQNAAGTVQASYTDTLAPELESPDATALVIYAVEVLNTAGRSAGFSNQVQVPAAPTLPPPGEFKAHTVNEGVLLTWTGIPSGQEIPGVSYRYRVYRRQEGSNADAVVGELLVGGAQEVGLVDRSLEWQKTYYYRATVVTVISREDKPDVTVEGDDTPIVKVFADDVFPPAVPSGLQAVFSGSGQQPFVDVVWTPDTDADLAGYNVYRREEGGQPAKLNTELVKTPAYRDGTVASGKTYLYSVSAVDLRGNESARAEETSEMVP